MEIYVAKFDFCQDCESSLSFKRGDKFLVTDKMDGGWWAARSLSSNEIGYIPSSYIECIAILDPLTLKHLDMPPKPDRIKMDALCELTAKIQQSSSPGRNHPRSRTENYFDDGREAPPTPPELKRTTTPLSLSKEQNELQRDLKFNQQRGLQLGRPELVKQWEKFEHKKTVKAEKGKTTENELETKLRNISQKLEDLEKQQEVEAKKPEFMKVNLKKAKKEVEAS